MLRSTLLVSLSGLAAAASNYNFNTHQAHQKGLLIPGAGSQALTFSLTGTCTGSQKSCGDACIESGGQCCSPSLGTYCEDGTYCTASGCCPDGEVCSGTPTGCAKGKELCGQYCMPEGKVCCGTGYCNEGQTCSLGECTTGSGSSGGSSGGSGGGSSGGGSSGGGSSGGSSGPNCYSFQEECDDGCMPKGSVCCGGGKYCFSGETCLSDGTCRYGSSSGGGGSSGGSSGGSDDDDDDNSGSGSGSGSSSDDDDDDATITRPSLTEPTFSSPSFTEPSLEPVPTIGEEPTISSRPLPTGPRSGGPDDDDGSDSSSSSNSSGGGGSNAGAINVPSFLVGLVALVPLLL